MDERDLAVLLREHASRHSVPGAAVGILRDGRATAACFGVADVATGEPVTLDTRFSLGSLTKSLVATVIVRLAESGRLALDDPVAAHVPELRRRDWAGRATLRDLLANRSGLPLTAELEFGFSGRGEDDGALARLAADVAAAAPVAGIWSYTNAGWCLLGRAIESVCGTTWEEAMRPHLAGLGLRETAFPADPGSAPRASGHEVTAAGPVPVAPLAGRAYGPAGTSLVSTVTDLLRFAAAHLADPALAGLRATAEEIAIHGWLDAWCLGWARFDWRGASVWGGTGWSTGSVRCCGSCRSAGRPPSWSRTPARAARCTARSSRS